MSKTNVSDATEALEELVLDEELVESESTISAIPVVIAAMVVGGLLGKFVVQPAVKWVRGKIQEKQESEEYPTASDTDS